jgi:hypothetical protein
LAEISAIVLGHSEAELLATSLQSALLASQEARQRGIDVTVSVCLDRPTPETEAAAKKFDVPILRVDVGDPGLARNMAIDHFHANFVALLDGDDLWGPSWLWRAYEVAVQSPKCVFHPYASLYFGEERRLFLHGASTQLNPWTLAFHNPWTVTSFARRDTFLEVRFRETEFAKGWAFEDWHWNCETLAAGFTHDVVPKTCHFIRVKPLSQQSMSANLGTTLAPTLLFRGLPLPAQDLRTPSPFRAFAYRQWGRLPSPAKRLLRQFMRRLDAQHIDEARMPWLKDELLAAASFENQLASVSLGNLPLMQVSTEPDGAEAEFAHVFGVGKDVGRLHLCPDMIQAQRISKTLTGANDLVLVTDKPHREFQGRLHPPVVSLANAMHGKRPGLHIQALLRLITQWSPKEIVWHGSELFDKTLKQYSKPIRATAPVHVSRNT